MASMNWLDFSLSPQELPSQPLNDEEDHSQTLTPLLGFNPHEISATECFDLSSFGLVEAPNRNNTHHITPLDYWNTKGLGTSCSSNHNMDNNQQHPKLENFLLEKPATGDGGSPKNTNSIGLSMIKTWLMKQTSSQSDAANTSLSMSTRVSLSQSGTVALPLLTAGEERSSSKSKQSGILNVDTVSRKSADTFGKRTSIYRGVSRHRWTGRYEAHLWDNSSRREGKTSKGKQVYLGGYDKEEKAARAYDLAALKYWGATTTTNFPIIHYEKELEEMKNLTRQEYVASLRRKSSGFSRGASIYRGVTRHHQHGRWQARIGRVAVNKDLYLGTFNTQEEAAEAYDIAAIKFRGLKAVTNFDMNRYDVKSILESSTLPIGGAAKRLKEAEPVELTIMDPQTPHVDSNINIFGASHHSLALHQPQPYSHLNYTYGQKFWIDSASVDNNNNSSGSNYVIYCGGDGYAIPMATPTSNIADDDDVVVQNSRSNGLEHNDVNMLGYENVFSSNTDPYHARDLCYLSQPASDDAVKGSAYDACNTWVPFVIPSTLALRHTSDICSGASPFTLLHE